MANGVVDIPLSGTPLEDGLSPSLSLTAPFALPQFVAGPENHLVEVAVAAVLENTTEAYSPLVLHGPSGSGKTHLAGGLLYAWKKRYPRRPAVMVTAADFAREFRDALETKTEDQFDAPYARARLLVLEDLDQLKGRTTVQQALIALIDRLLEAGSWVVVTAHRSAARMGGLQPALVARLSSGLTLPLALPGLETRTAILERVARLRGLEVDDDVLTTLARGLAVPVPELVGALVQLEGESRLDQSVISIAAAHRLLAERLTTRRPGLSRIAKETAKQFAMPVADLRGPSRRRAIVTARNVAMYLARNLTEKSLDRIGVYFGNRDHTTVSHGCRGMEARMQTEPTLREAVTELQTKLLLR